MTLADGRVPKASSLSRGTRTFLKRFLTTKRPASPSWKWFGVKSVYAWARKGNAKQFILEERVMLVRARSVDEACRKVEREERLYCRVDRQANFVIRRVPGDRCICEPDAEMGTVYEAFSALHKQHHSTREFMKYHLPGHH